MFFRPPDRSSTAQSVLFFPNVIRREFWSFWRTRQIHRLLWLPPLDAGARGVVDRVEWSEEPVARRHDRKGFDCGSPELSEYLERYARQNHETGGAKTFVAVPLATTTTQVLGYYSISPGAI